MNCSTKRFSKSWRGCMGKRSADSRERTIEIANQSHAFGPRALRAALDSSPLWGAGRVEDTYNLVGHALKKVMRVVADQQGRELAEVAQEAGPVFVYYNSLNDALDRKCDQHLPI